MELCDCSYKHVDKGKMFGHAEKWSDEGNPTPFEDFGLAYEVDQEG